MYQRLFKRIEKLIRVGLDKTASANERELALTEALKIAAAGRAGVVSYVEWRETMTPMQHLACERCPQQIKPSEKKFTNGQAYRHLACHELVLRRENPTSAP